MDTTVFHIGLAGLISGLLSGAIVAGAMLSFIRRYVPKETGPPAFVHLLQYAPVIFEGTSRLVTGLQELVGLVNQSRGILKILGGTSSKSNSSLSTTTAARTEAPAPFSKPASAPSANSSSASTPSNRRGSRTKTATEQSPTPSASPKTQSGVQSELLG